MKKKGDRYQLDDGIDPYEDNYFAVHRPSAATPHQSSA
jgi:hypothetical protein